MEVINPKEKLTRIHDHWHPRIIAELNGQEVRAAKILGAFDWHRHEEEDELFLVVHGRFRLEFRDRVLEVGEGEMVVVPRGVEHRPVADEECHVLLFEPAETRNTGSVVSARTHEKLERL